MNKPFTPSADQALHDMARNIDGSGRALADHTGIILDLHRLQFTPAQIELYLYRAIDKAGAMLRARGPQSIGQVLNRVIGRMP